MSDPLNIAVLVDAKLLNRRLFIRPEAVADLHREPVEGDPAVGGRAPDADLPPAEFLQRVGHTLAVALEQIRQLHRLPYHPRAVPVHVQAQEDIQLEHRIGKQGQGCGYLLVGGEPTGGPFQPQAGRRDHALPAEPAGSPSTWSPRLTGRST